MATIAAGLITRFDLNTTTGYWVGSLILLGLGLGTSGQQAMMVVQTVLEGSDISLGTSILIFAQTLCGSVFLSVSENVLQAKLVSELKSRVPSVDPAVVVGQGASGLKSAMSQLYPADVVRGILKSYAKAMQSIFIIGLVLVSVGLLGVPFIEWKSVKGKKERPTAKGTQENVQDDSTAAEMA